MESNHLSPKAPDLQSGPLPSTEYFPLCDSRLDCYAVTTQLRPIQAFTTLRQFSAGIVILCEDFRYSHIIRERPGLTESEGVEPSVLFLPLWVCFTPTVIPSGGFSHFSAIIRQNTFRTTTDFRSASHVHLLAQTLLHRPPDNAHVGNCIRFSTSGRSRFF